MQYTGRSRLGSLADHMEEGLARLRRIHFHNWPLEVKAQVVRSSIYPAAFHGCELFPIGEQHLTRFRSKTAEAILQIKNQSMSPVIFFLAVPCNIVDPGLHVIQQALLQARQWLLQCTQVERNQFYSIAAGHSTKVGTSKGPASTLAHYVLRLGWQITKQGQLLVGDFVKLCLHTTSTKELKHWTMQAWTQHAIVAHTSRFSLFGLPPVDRTSTIQVLKKIPSHLHRVLLRFISQAFQPGNQRAKWAGEQAQSCDFCAQPDDKRRRLLGCPVFQAVRDRHPAAVTILEEEMPGWVDLPLIFRQPHAEYIQTVHYQMCDAAIPHEVLQMHQDHCPGLIPTFFTDGSCREPHMPVCRYASYAIVLDTSVSASERATQVEKYHATQTLPDTLQIVGQGRLPGLQGIHRAEILALVLVMEATPVAICYTDSQVAMGLIAAIRRVQGPHELHGTPEFDLILRIFAVLTDQHVIRKIRAHQHVDITVPFEDAYRLLGNQAADECAGCAVTSLFPEFAADLRQQALDVGSAQDMFQQVLLYIADLQKSRAKADQGEDFTTASNQRVDVPFDPFQYLINWSPVGIWSQPNEYDFRWIHACAWSSELADATIRYLQDCEWPAAQPANGTSPIGISWLEIAIGVMHYLGEYIPVRRADASGQLHLIRLRNFSDIQLHNVSLREMGENLSMLFQQLMALTPTQLMPPVPRCRVHSLYILGATTWAHGFQLRPRTPFQEETTIQIQLYLQSGRKMPNLGFDQPTCSFLPTSWQQRQKIARQAMKEVREFKKVSLIPA